MKAMVFAAGLGTRLKPVTDKIPKPLIEINGKPVIEYVLERLIKNGVDEVIINIHHFGSQIVDYIDSKKSYGIRIEFSDESDLLLDTGGGLKKAYWFFNDSKPFILYNGDILSDIDLKKMYNAHAASGAIATLAVRNRKTSRYFLFDKNNILCGWRNSKTEEEIIKRQYSSELSPLAFSGIHIINPLLFRYFPGEVKFSMVELYLNMAPEEIIKGYDHSGDKWIDIGKPESLKKAELYFTQ